MNQLSCLAKIIVETITPDHSKLIYEISKHEFIITKPEPESQWLPSWYKILFTTSDTCVVQQCELTAGETRFVTFGIPLSAWEKFFFGWIGEDLWDAQMCWDHGMRQYGANV